MTNPALAIQTFGRFQVFLGAAPILNAAWGTRRAAALSAPAMQASFLRHPHSRLILKTSL
jgi:hypothetical protein